MAATTPNQSFQKFTRSQYPHRRASSWRLGPVHEPTGLREVSIPSQAGILLAGVNLACSWEERWSCLNTLTGGHPLGGQLFLWQYRADPTVSQYPHRRASSWREVLDDQRAGGEMVSIPSQAGILLAVGVCWFASGRREIVSIPSQAGILLADHQRNGDAADQSDCLNTLTGGHPLGGRRPSDRQGRWLGLNTLTGGHPLGGGGRDQADQARGDQSQYPHRRASSWRRRISLFRFSNIWSQYPHRRASSWRWVLPELPTQAEPSLNTLTGGHPLGGQHQLRRRLPKMPSSQYPHRRASSWRDQPAPVIELVAPESQYPHRRASSWRG